MSDTTQTFPPYPQGSGSSGVISLNSLTGVLSLISSDSSVTITPSGSTINLQASGGGGGVTSLNILTGAVVITSPHGTLSVGTSGSDVTLDVDAPLPVSYGGTGTISPALIAGSGISITGSWPDQTIAATGSAPSFSAITTGTNTSATMTVGPGGVLTFSGSGSPPSEGEVNANFLYGVQISGTAPTTGQVLTATSSTSANWQTPSSGGGGVTSLNSLTGALSIVAGSNITVTPSGSNITIAASRGGSTAQTLWAYPKVSVSALTNMNPVNSGNMNFSANKVVFMYIHIDVPITVGNFTFLPTTGDATHHYDWGMYTLSGTLVWNLGATIFSVGSSTQQTTTPMAQGTITIQPGNYWLAFTGNGTGITWWSASPSSLSDWFFFANSPTGTPIWWTSSTTSSGGTLTGLNPVVPSAPTTAGNLTNSEQAGSSAGMFPVFALST